VGLFWALGLVLFSVYDWGFGVGFFVVCMIGALGLVLLWCGWLGMGLVYLSV